MILITLRPVIFIDWACCREIAPEGSPLARRRGEPAGMAPALVVSIDEPAASETLANSYPASRNHSWFEENYFLVPPGETRSVRVSLPAGISSPLRVKAWNSDAVNAALPGTTK